jgi:hypothetical protein
LGTQVLDTGSTDRDAVSPVPCHPFTSHLAEFSHGGDIIPCATGPSSCIGPAGSAARSKPSREVAASWHAARPAGVAGS